MDKRWLSLGGLQDNLTISMMRIALKFGFMTIIGGMITNVMARIHLFAKNQPINDHVLLSIK